MLLSVSALSESPLSAGPAASGPIPITLAGTVVSVLPRTAAGLLALPVRLTGAASVTCKTYGPLSIAIPFSGAPVARARVNGSLHMAVALIGSGAPTRPRASGLISVQGPPVTLSGAASYRALSASGSVDVQKIHLLWGSAVLRPSASGAIGSGATLGGAAIYRRLATGYVTHVRQIAAHTIARGWPTVKAAASGSIGVGASLSGSATRRLSASGALGYPLKGTASIRCIGRGSVRSGNDALSHYVKSGAIGRISAITRPEVVHVR